MIRWITPPSIKTQVQICNTFALPKVTTPKAVHDWFTKYVAAPRYKRSETLRFNSADGVRLHAVRLTGPVGSKVTVVLVHGFAHWHRHPKIHQFAHHLADHANVVVVDLRGHGLSGGTSTLGALEWLDVKAAVEQIPADQSIVLIGASMGASAVVLYAGMAARGDGGRGADAVVAVSGPAWWGGPDAAKGVGRVLELTRSPLMRAAMRHLMRVRIDGVRSAGRIDPVTIVSEIAPTPLFIVHDRADWYFGADQAEAMHEAAGSSAQLWWREGGHATDLFDDELCNRIVDDVVGPLAVASDLRARVA
ncbi:MAG TPA: alpha/beta fold hydrolase [Acidimicrobiales bacterium]|nr:alpha/beta fold hydrolase [Acidimicrobiales bacterium]